MSLLKSERARLWAVLLIALAVRLVAVGAVGDRALEYEFATLTENLLAGHGYAYWSETTDGALTEAHVEGPARTFPSAYMPVGYPLFLWALASLFGTGPGGVITIEVVQALLGVLACWLTFLVGRDRFSAAAGLWAALGFAVFPLLAYTPAQISASNLIVVLLLATLWALFRAERTGAWGAYALAGLLFGVSALVRAQFVAFVPVAVVALAVARAPRAWRGGALLALVAALTLAPWTLRNAAVLGVATPLTTSGGHNLWQAYGPLAAGTHGSYTHPPRPFPADLRAELEALPRTPHLEVAIDSVYRERALASIADDPGRVAALAPKKLWLYWVHFGAADIRYPGVDSPLFWGPWLLTLPLFFYGLWLSFRRAPRRYAFLYLYLLGQTAIVVAFFVLPRYRLEVLPVMLLFAGEAVRALAAWLAARRSPAGRTLVHP